MMFIECMAIVVVLVIIFFMTARSGRRDIAWTIAPLVIVPACYLLSSPLSKVLDAMLPMISRGPLAIGVTVFGLVVACILFGLLCGNYTSPGARGAYLVMCSGFSTILAVVLILNLIQIIH